MVKSSEIVELLKKANELGLTEFVFTKDGKTYGCFWRNLKWSDPEQILNFGEI